MTPMRLLRSATSTRAALLAFSFAYPIFLAACAPDQHAWAGRVTSPGQLVGGPRSLGQLGDWRLSNGRVRFIVQDLNMIPAGAANHYGTAGIAANGSNEIESATTSGATIGPGTVLDANGNTLGIPGDRNYATFGGTLIDADIARPEAEADPRATGDGADGLGELFPAFFLAALEPSAITVLDDGSTGNPARIRVVGVPSEFLTQTKFVDDLALGSGLTFSLDYALGPDDDYLSITASMTNPTSADHTFPTSLFPVPIGFIGLFGQDQPLFLPGEAGFDLRFGLERTYQRKYALPALAGLTTDVVVVDAKRISYGLSYCPQCTTPIQSTIPNSASFVAHHAGAYSPYAPVGDNSMLLPFVSGSLFGIFMGEVPTSLPATQTYGVTMKLRVGAPTPSYQIDAVFGEQGVDVGQFTGRVREESTLDLLEGAEVIVYQDANEADAGLPHCAAGPDGLGCMITAAKADSEGRFHALVPPGDYKAVVRHIPHPDSAPVSFSVTFNQQTYRELYSPRAATLVAEITDETGRRTPAKVTLTSSYGAEHANQDPKTFLYDYRLGDPFRPTDLIHDNNDPADDAGTRRYIEDTFYAQDGRVNVGVRPGNYRATISRGPAYPIAEQEIILTAGQATRIGATLTRALPADGWVQADFHVHAAHSVDSSMPYPRRALSAAGEGLDFIAMTEHNFIGDIRPTIDQVGLIDFLQATTGIEQSTLEAGHWNAYPLQYDETLSTHGALPWFRRNPGDLVTNLHAIGRYGPAATMVEVNHPRDSVQGYFTTYGVTGFSFTGNPAHDWPGKAGLLIPSGPGFGGSEFTLDGIDAMEVLNNKRYDLLHSYRVPEVLPPAPIPPLCSQSPSAKPCIGAAGTLVLDKNGLVADPGGFEDWEHILDSGRRIVAVGNSDTHEQYDEPGTPRNMINIGHDWTSASQLDEQEIIAALIAGRSVQSNGPEILLTLLDPSLKDAAGNPVEVPIGGMVQPDADGTTVHAHLVVRAAPWVQVSRVQLLVGKGMAVDETYGDPRSQEVVVDSTSTIATRLDTVVALQVNPGKDVWVAALATGDKTLWPVITQFEVPPLLLNDAVSQLTGAFGQTDPLGNLTPSLISLVTPFALANPVFVDGNRDGVWGIQPAAGSRTRQQLAAHPATGNSRGASVARDADTEGDLARLIAALSSAANRAQAH